MSEFNNMGRHHECVLKKYYWALKTNHELGGKMADFFPVDFIFKESEKSFSFLCRAVSQHTF